MPLEQILGLTHPSITNPEPTIEDKRTWRRDRTGSQQAQAPGGSVDPKEIKWTAMEIMTAYALRKGWVTAKAGRPDVNRAGNASECCTSIITFCPLKLHLVSSSGRGGESRVMGFLATREPAFSDEDARNMDHQY